MPTTQEVTISIDYNNELMAVNDEFILQVGIATSTPPTCGIENKQTCNVALVVDVSTSMSGTKIDVVKQSLQMFVNSLNDGDYISLSVFGSEGKTLIPSTQLASNRQAILNKIKAINVSGMTNLNEGMLLGYKEVIKNHSKHTSSRVLLLTDGMTNVGETNHKQIIENSKIYTHEGINITTIGVGNDLDFELLQDLSKAGRGANYFITDREEDIAKVFEEELQALVSSIGHKPDIEITIPSNWEIIECYGYNPTFLSSHKLAVPLENLSYNSTQVILLKIKKEGNDSGVISSLLSYTKEDKLLTVKEEIEYSSRMRFSNKELAKNYAIASMAKGLKDASIILEKKDIEQSKRIIRQTAQCAKELDFACDKDFDRVFDIIMAYQP